MFLVPMYFMLAVTLTSLLLTVKTQGAALLAGTGGLAAAMQVVIALLLLALSLVLVQEGRQALRGRRNQESPADDAPARK